MPPLTAKAPVPELAVCMPDTRSGRSLHLAELGTIADRRIRRGNRARRHARPADARWQPCASTFRMLLSMNATLGEVDDHPGAGVVDVELASRLRGG